MTEILLPCPFCGGEAKLKTARESDGQISYDSIYVACLNCRSTGLSYTTYYNVSSNPEEEAIAAWNRRTGKDINVATNADRIRGATDEKLANVISAALGKMSYGCYRCPAEDFCHSGECEQAWLDWLQQPAKPERSEG